MAESSEALLKILEPLTTTHTQLAESLLRLEQRQQEHNLTLAQAIGENTRLVAKDIEANSQALAQRLERIDQRMTQRDQAVQNSVEHLADVLKYVAEMTSRTERMTAGILARLGSLDPAQ